MSSVGSTWMPGLFSGSCAARGDGVWRVRGRCRRNRQWHPHVVSGSSGILDADGHRGGKEGVSRGGAAPFGGGLVFRGVGARRRRGTREAGRRGGGGAGGGGGGGGGAGGGRGGGRVWGGGGGGALMGAGAPGGGGGRGGRQPPAVVQNKRTAQVG